MSDRYNDDSDDNSVYYKDAVEDVQEPILQETRYGRVTRPPNNLEPRHRPGRQAHGNIFDAGVNFSLIGKSNDSKGDRIECQYTGAVYTNRQGVVHINIDDETPAPIAMSDEESDAHTVGVIFDHHFSLNKGLKIFGEKANVTVQKELSQIHEMDTYEPIMKSSLTIEDRRKALASLMLITKKRSGDTKTRKMADFSKQRTYNGYDKSDGLLTNVAMDSIFLTGVVDACENREISILDIDNTFLHTENDEKSLMLLRGKLAEMMLQVYPIMYHKYMTYSPNVQDTL